jgi:uncharacterized protein YacL
VLGLITAPYLKDLLSPYPEYYSFLLVVLIFTSLGFLLGYYLSKRLKDITSALDELLVRIPGVDLLVGVIGLLTGLVIATLVSLQFYDLPYGRIYSLVSLFLFGFIGLFLSLKKSRELAYFILGKKFYFGKKVLDTSAVIDGRVMALLKSGLLEGVIIIPEKVIEETKSLADSDDQGKRRRGQRGLKNLQEIYENFEERVVIESVELDVPSVDDYLVELCKKEGAALITADSNLALAARAKGVKAVNINELQNEMRLPVAVGDTVEVELVREGSSKGQAVGYLDDGTMIVVEDGRKLIGEKARVRIKGVVFSSTGRVFFARIDDEVRKKW